MNVAAEIKTDNFQKPFDIRQRTFEFAVEITKLSAKIRKQEKEFTLSKQLLRSGISVGANIREAHNGESNADFIHKFSIAQKECDETVYWIEIIIASGIFSDPILHYLKDEAQQLLKIIKIIIINKKQNSGVKK